MSEIPVHPCAAYTFQESVDAEGYTSMSPPQQQHDEMYLSMNPIEYENN